MGTYHLRPRPRTPRNPGEPIRAKDWVELRCTPRRDLKNAFAIFPAGCICKITCTSRGVFWLEAQPDQVKPSATSSEKGSFEISSVQAIHIKLLELPDPSVKVKPARCENGLCNKIIKPTEWLKPHTPSCGGSNYCYFCNTWLGGANLAYLNKFLDKRKKRSRNGQN